MDEQKTRGRKVPEEEKAQTEKLFNDGKAFFNKIENKSVVKRALHMLQEHYMLTTRKPKENIPQE